MCRPNKSGESVPATSTSTGMPCIAVGVFKNILIVARELNDSSASRNLILDGVRWECDL